MLSHTDLQSIDPKGTQFTRHGLQLNNPYKISAWNAGPTGHVTPNVDLWFAKTEVDGGKGGSEKSGRWGARAARVKSPKINHDNGKNQPWMTRLWYLGAKEPGVIYFPTNWGAKEPQNLPNHRVDEDVSPTKNWWFSMAMLVFGRVCHALLLGDLFFWKGDGCLSDL